MSKPVALALLLAIGFASGGCGKRRSAEPPATAEQRPEPPSGAARRDCPVEGPQPAKGSVCIARRGPNWTYAFVYPSEAARIPALQSWLRNQAEDDLRTEREENDGDGLGALSRYAKEHPEDRFFRETVYTSDSDLSGLLALTGETSEYSGGAHGWFGFQTLLWDKTRDRKLELGELFSDPLAASTEMRDELCPALNELRRSRNSMFNGRCEEPPYETMTLLAEGGRVTRLKVTFNELEGYAGGVYTAYVPVTRRLLGLVAERFRADFAFSPSPPKACNNDEDCVEKRPLGPRPQ
jgi:hypothetical protein